MELWWVFPSFLEELIFISVNLFLLMLLVYGYSYLTNVFVLYMYREVEPLQFAPRKS